MNRTDGDESVDVRCVHVAAGIDDSRGGPAKVIPHLAFATEKEGVRNLVLAVRNSREERNEVLARNGIHCRLLPGWASIAPQLGKALREQAGENAVVHLHSLWRYPSYCVYQLARRKLAPVIYSSHSALYRAALAQGQLKKRVAWHMYARHLLMEAACVHATEPNELEAIKQLNLGTPVALIPNGVDVAEFASVPIKAEAKARLGLRPDKRYALFLSRIHPRKGLDILAEAWISNAHRYPDWDLLVVGPEEDAGYLRQIERRIAKAGLSNRWTRTGLLRGEDKVCAYAASDIFVLPSQFENFGLAIAEALAAGLPVITSQTTPWPQIAECRAGWWISPQIPAIGAALREAFDLDPAALRRLGTRGQRIVEDMSWLKVGERMAQVYGWALGRCAKPDCVY